MTYLLLASLCAACGSSTPSAVSKQSTASVPSRTTVVQVTPASVPPTQPSTTLSPMCRTSGMRMTMGDDQGAAGNTAIPILFENIGRAPCHMFGFPGISWVTSAGSQIGLPVTHEATAPTSAVLNPGSSAVSVILNPSPPNQHDAGCISVPAYGIKVYPPGNSEAVVVTNARLLLQAGMVVCTNGRLTSSVNAVSPWARG